MRCGSLLPEPPSVTLTSWFRIATTSGDVTPVGDTDLRRQLRHWLEENWDPDVALIEWRNRLADSGWGCPAWPRQWGGRSLPLSVTDMAAEELARIGAVGLPEGVGMHLAAPTILQHGSDQLKSKVHSTDRDRRDQLVPALQ